MSLLYRNPNIYYGTGRRRRVRRKRGGNFLSDIGSALSSAHDFVKKHKLISTIGNALGSVGVPYAGAIGKTAGVLGYGRRRKTRRKTVRRRRGGDVKSVLSSLHKFVKDKRLISSGLRHFLPKSNLHKAAHTLGYGRRRRVRRRKGGDVKSVLSSLHKFVKDKRLISSGLRHFLPKSNLHKAAHTLGYGRRRVRRVRRRRGGDIKSTLSSIHKFVKDKRLISSGLRHFLPKSNLHKAAHSLGYGRKRTVRRTVRRRPVRHRGGAYPFSTEQIAAPKF